jgi:mycothiol synthase
MTQVAEGPLTPAQARSVLELAAAARAADGVAPLSEHVMLHVRHGGAVGSDAGTGAGGREVLVLSDSSEETVVGYAYLDAPDDETQAGDMSGELVIHPGHRRRKHGTALVAALTADADSHGVRIWSHGDLPGAAAFAKSTGFTRFRELWQMRRPLSGAEFPEVVLPAGITLRAFRPGADDEAWLAVNRRAFAHHPEQGSWTREDLELRQAEPWFDPAGFFIAEKDGAVIGFHWTKVHPDGGSSGGPVGEVYVVGVDPGQQGGGLGKALTLAGLVYLRDRGLDEVMLYVDGDNTAATGLYTKLGFGQWHTDVMYRHA